jgi:hypothetical protein
VVQNAQVLQLHRGPPALQVLPQRLIHRLIMPTHT